MNLLQRKYLSLFIIFVLACNGVLAETIKDMDASFKTIPQGEYKHKTVKKHYRMYDVRIKNNGKKPVLLSSSSEVIFVSTLGQQEVSPSRRTIYRKSRKRDIGRYYWFALPGAIIAGGITGITFFLGAPIGAAVYVGMYLPTDKAVRNNVRISQEIFNTKALPIRLEPQKEYFLLIPAPKNIEVKKIVITNVSYDLNKQYDLEIREESL